MEGSEIHYVNIKESKEEVHHIWDGDIIGI
jgi:hypothetical protein